MAFEALRFATGSAISYIRPMKAFVAKYAIGQVVRHRIFPFRGIIFDVDPVFNNTEEWWLAIPEAVRPAKDQPFYHLFAENCRNGVRGLRFGTELAAGRLRRASSPSERKRRVRAG